MTSFATLEASLEGSRPLEIFTLSIGSLVFNYTSNASDVTVDSVLYTAVAIRRGPLGQGVEERRKTLVLTLPGNDEFVTYFIGTPPGDNSRVTIKQLQRDESPTFNTKLTRYKGLVQNVRFVGDGTQAEVSCQSAESLNSKAIPRHTFSALCNRVLYAPDCGVNPAGFRISGPCTAIAGRVITVTNANTKPDGYFNGGFCQLVSGGDYRFIISHVGNNLTLLLPFLTDITGGDVVVSAGCNHLIDGDCATKFSNRPRHGGWPFVPTKNIFATGLQ